MPEFVLTFAERHLKRIFTRAVGKSIPKILTELITNADDSYRRIVDSANQASKQAELEDPAPIAIIFERSKRQFSVIDHAEGLTDEEMEERFVTYGQESPDRERGFRTRSLFGKGLRDVLFTQYHGQVKSIKNELFYNCRFRWKEVDGTQRPIVDIKAPCRVTPELRKALRIPRNGTRVEFQLAEDIHNPQPDKLIDLIKNFYLLRMINSSPHREVILEVIPRHGRESSETQISYRFPKIEVMDRFEDDLKTDTGATIHIEGEIGSAEKEMTQGEVGYVEREGGLLVIDEDDNVLELSLFGFDEDTAARRLSGILRLKGAGAFIRAKLNQKDPEEVLTETRDGFDKNHPFFRALRTRIQPRLEPIISKIREETPEPKSKLPERIQEKHKKAFDILNQLANKLLGKTGKVPVIPAHLQTPPINGIAFATSHISIQKGISTPAALLINTNLVQLSDTVIFESDRPEITVVPQFLIIEEEGSSIGLLIKILRIKSDIADISGNITATWKEIKSALQVTTTTREVITPINGLEFELDEYAVKLNARRNLRLFVDLTKIPLESEITITPDAPAVRILKRNVVLQTSHLVTPQVAQIEIAVKGLELTKETIVNASQAQYVAGTKVSVVKKRDRKKGMQGLFKDFKFKPLQRKVQSLFDMEGYILINTLDPVNQRYFGAEPYKAVEENSYCQIRLADLILNECLQIMVSRALEYGKLDRRFPDNPEFDVRNYVDEKKFEIGLEIHSLFVDKFP
jgi:hypothetical protein